MKSYSPRALVRARALRKSWTDAELRLWQLLRNRSLHVHKFRRQHPVGPYFADFVCLDKKLVVEVDGSQHMERNKRDLKRTAFLESRGFRVIRFWDN